NTRQIPARNALANRAHTALASANATSGTKRFSLLSFPQAFSVTFDSVAAKCQARPFPAALPSFRALARALQNLAVPVLPEQERVHASRQFPVDANSLRPANSRRREPVPRTPEPSLRPVPRARGAASRSRASADNRRQHDSPPA